MPDDCGHIELRFNTLLGETELWRNNIQVRPLPKPCAFTEINSSRRTYTRVCAYCRTDPKKDTCVNCGAPQVVEIRSQRTYDEFGMVSFKETKGNL